ncbi:MAG: CBS domain-containing protein [Actinomycetota bacterium]
MRTLVADVMTADVAAVEPSTPARTIAGLLDARKISAVPVVDRDSRVVGVVSEADVLHHRYTARNAEQIMTKPAVTVRRDQPAVAAARLMEQHRIKRLPVVDDYGRLAGIVSRSDLVHAYASGDDLRLTEI